MTVARVLHVLPRCTGAGPERSLLASLAFAPAPAPGIPEFRHSIAVLEPPVAAAMFVAARRLGADVLVRPDDAALAQAAADADIVVIHYWNHPLLLSTLGRVDLGPTRVVVWSMVLGLHRPQVLTAELGEFADVLVVSSERSRPAPAAEKATTVRYVAGIADMRRLDGWKPIPHDDLHVGYLGLVSPVKMHPRFVDLCALVREPAARFVVVGAGGGEARLLERAVDAGLGDRLVHIPYTDDIATALGTFDVFGYPLGPDTYATSEKALQEAMWVGIPPVVFPHGGLADIVEHDRSGLVAHSDDEYAASIDRLLADTALRRRLGDGARRSVRERFDPRVLARRWADALTTALEVDRRSRAPLYDGCTGAELFVRAMGHASGPFGRSLGRLQQGHDTEPADAAEIAGSSPLVASGDGGVIHYRNTWPHDEALARWATLVTVHGSATDPS